MRLTILAFNFGPTKNFTNGPGMSLYNFCKALAPHFKIDLFLDIKNEVNIPGISFYSSKDHAAFFNSIQKTDAVHHWSGLTSELKKRVRKASDLGKKIILGQNLLDCVELKKEKELLQGLGHKTKHLGDGVKKNSPQHHARNITHPHKHHHRHNDNAFH